MRMKTALRAGITGLPDGLLARWKWGRLWSRIGDFHDELYRRGCPRKWADYAFDWICRAFGQGFLASAAKPFFAVFGKWRYDVKDQEGWTRIKLKVEVDQCVWNLEMDGYRKRRPHLPWELPWR